MLWNCDGYDGTVGIYYVPHDMISIFEKMLTHNISQAGSRAIWTTTTADTESSHLCPDTQWNIPVVAKLKHSRTYLAKHPIYRKTH